MARPSKYTSELAEAICLRMADGESLRAICRDPDMPSRETIRRWLAKPGEDFEAFRGQYARARELQADALIEDCIAIADDARFDWVERQRNGGASVLADHEHIQRSRLRVDTRKWAAARIAPWKYGDKVQVDQHVKGEVEHKPQHNHTLPADPEGLAEVLAILARFQGGESDEGESGEPTPH